MSFIASKKDSPIKELPDDLINIKQASDLINLKTRTIYNLIARKEIPHFKNRKAVLFSKSELIIWRYSDIKRIGGSNGK